MKLSIISAALLLPLSTHAAELELDFHGEGLAGQTVMVSIFNSADSFMSEKHFRAFKVRVVNDRVGVAGLELPPGKYAIAAYVDRNQNGKLDRNFIGKPSEPYGFSRDARHMFRSPIFAEAAFVLGDVPAVQSILLK